MDPFDEEQYIKRGCNNGFNCSEIRGTDEDLESERRESDAEISQSQGNVEQRDMGREISEKEMHSVRKVRAFPPLLTSLPNKSFTSFSHLMPPVLLKPLRSKGRLVLQEAKVVGTAMFQPVRRDGRLLLQLPRQDDDQYLAMNEEIEEAHMEREEIATEKPMFEATGTLENQETLGKPSNDVQEMGQGISQSNSGSMELNQCCAVLYKQSGEVSHQLVSHSEDVKAGFDRQHNDEIRTKFVIENDAERCSTNTEAWDSALPESVMKNSKGVIWTKACGDVVKQDVQTLAFTNSDLAGPVNLTKSAFEGYVLLQFHPVILVSTISLRYLREWIGIFSSKTESIGM
ncbi:hypothetical protein O6H91_01G040700 [Diphasiastrum complanatum]|uniref:Uncharacterized protein n=1 Tax=Diphasiastrum complanatum TaxID=34168 RepID=A0ACC2EQ66_DIPCM|nr:hypothetical protein O6H91_01G040700 [Diphasiastrum complanatum]